MELAACHVVLGHEGRDLTAIVALLPFYDPDGKRMKS